MIPSETFKTTRIKLVCKSIRRQGDVKVVKLEVVYHSPDEAAGRRRTDAIDTGPLVVIHVRKQRGEQYLLEPGDSFFVDVTKAPK